MTPKISLTRLLLGNLHCEHVSALLALIFIKTPREVQILQTNAIVLNMKTMADRLSLDDREQFESEVNLLSVITALIFTVTLMMVVGAMLTMVAL